LTRSTFGFIDRFTFTSCSKYKTSFGDISKTASTKMNTSDRKPHMTNSTFKNCWCGCAIGYGTRCPACRTKTFVYISTQWAHRAEAAALAAELEQVSNILTFPWWDPTALGKSETDNAVFRDGATAAEREAALKLAVEDLENAANADVFVLIGQQESSSGRLSELAAWCRSSGKMCIVIGPATCWETATLVASGKRWWGVKNSTVAVELISTWKI
jgi:hypothetical protein